MREYCFVSMSAGQRIAVIREAMTLLDKQEWYEIDLVLEQHGLPTTNYGDWEGKAAYVMQMIRNASDDDLELLHAYLTSEAGGADRIGASPWSGTRLRLFCSHLAEEKSAVSAVTDTLTRFGVEPFVAHQAIEPSKEWAQVIEAALTDCDAMLVFLHPGFLESKWCDQEVGWALGRSRPILPLNYGIHPYGFLGKYQDQPCVGQPPYRVAAFVMDWLTKNPSLHGLLAHGLVDAFVTSGSWDFTRSVVPLLSRIASVTDDDLTRMERAAVDNIDVRECALPTGQSGPEWVSAFVKARRGPTEPAAWSEEPPF